MAEESSKVLIPLISSLLVLVLCINSVISLAVPSSSEQYCPIHKDLNEFDSTSHNDSTTRIIDLSKIESRKVTINFYTPNPMKPIERTLEETTVAFPYYLDDHTGSVIPLVPVVHAVPAKGQPSPSSKSTTSSLPSSASSSSQPSEYETTTTGGTEYYTEAVTETATDSIDTTTFSSVILTPQRSSLEPDVMCQWEFKTSNESEYLLLTFNNLSAPYSEDCSEAFVSMQKDDGYESRWCGTRRQMNQASIDFNDVIYLTPWGYVPLVYEEHANARPMALFSKRNAKVTVFRKGSSTLSPPTGFSVTVESIAVRNSLRVLLRGN